MRKLFIIISVLLLVLVLMCFAFIFTPTALDKALDRSYAAEAFWPSVKYTTVKAYLYNLDDPVPGTLPKPDILEDGKLVISVIDKKGVELSPGQVQRLIAAISKIPWHHNGHMTISASMCIFDPHHAFVFYDSAGNPVATIEICLLCNDIQVSPARKQYYQHDFKEIDSLCQELNLPVFHSHEEFNAYRKKR